MDGAYSTGRFIVAKRTLFQSSQRIRTQSGTFVTQPLAGAVSGTTIDSDHLAYDFLFPFIHLFSLNRSVKIAIIFLVAKQNGVISFSCSVVTSCVSFLEELLCASDGEYEPVVFSYKRKVLQSYIPGDWAAWPR